MKRWLPIRLKHWLWWVFKSPQRKVLGMSTLLTDIQGRFSLLSRPGQMQPLTVCIGIKDRSEHLLGHVIPSLRQCDDKNLITLSVFDAGSSDNADLGKAIREAWNGELVYRREEVDFTRSYTFNQAIMQAPTALVMACDADISLPAALVSKANRWVTARTAWFPQVWWLNGDKSDGRFFTEGTGIFASTKDNFVRAGGYDEQIKEWGKEDWTLFFAFYKTGTSCIRTNEPEMRHLPHPNAKPLDFVKFF